MTKQEFINYLDNLQATYVDESTEGHDCVRVYGKPTEIILFSGRKQFYTPYLRVSHFGEKDGYLYVRDNGYCDWYDMKRIHDICYELTYGRSVE